MNTDLMTDHTARPFSPEPPGITRVRIGLLLDSLRQPAWVHRTVSCVLESGFAEIVVVITEQESSIAARDRGRHGHGPLLFGLYRAFDTYWFRDDRPDPFVDADLAGLIAGVPHVGWSEENATQPGGTRVRAAEQIRELDLDLILQFGVDEPPGSIAALTRYGVWYHSGGSMGAGYLEVLTGSPVTQSALRVLPPDGSEARTIYHSFASTSALSGWKNRRELYWKTSAFVVRKLREMAEFGPSAAAGDTDAGVTDPAPAAASNVRMLGYLPRLASRYVSTQVAMRANFDQWFIAYRFAEGHRGGDIPDTRLGEFTSLTPPRDRIWADPFPMVHEGRHFVFLEELLTARRKGHISVMEFDRNGKPTRPAMVLEADNHLSYPFVLTWKGETFMIPESVRATDSPAESGSRSVPVYRANRFPFDWVQDTVMLEGLEVFDPTVVEIDGRWWLFCTQAEPGASTWDELHLFHGPSPFGPWTPHRRNPVKSDVRSARPAGRPYFHAGAWYRPAQNCSVRYGYGISINRIERLTPSEYKEVEVKSILPDWAPGLIGTHTLNAAGGLTVTDGRRRRSKWSPEHAELPMRPSTP